MMRYLVTLFAAFALSIASAQANTTVYVDSSHPDYAVFPNAVDSGASLGRPDGVSAQLPIGAFIAYLVNPTFTDVNFDVEFTGVTGAGTVRLYVGNTDGGTGFTTLNSEFFTVTTGVNTLASAALSTFCAGLGGCDTYVIQAWTGTTLSLDSIAAGAPEPSSWALMILAFGAIAWRMTAMRKSAAVAKLQTAAAFS